MEFLKILTTKAHKAHKGKINDFFLILIRLLRLGGEMLSSVELALIIAYKTSFDKAMNRIKWSVVLVGGCAARVPWGTE